MSKPATSLKALIAPLARELGMKPAALYERQRALVRAGLLHVRPGRGPGSGVPADAKSVAMLLISVLATGSLSEVEEQTIAIANLKSADGKCPVTGKKTFGAALTATLQSEALLRRALTARAARCGPKAMAVIQFTSEQDDFLETDQSTQSRFGADMRALLYTTNLAVETLIRLRRLFRGLELGEATSPTEKVMLANRGGAEK